MIKLYYSISFQVKGNSKGEKLRNEVDAEERSWFEKMRKNVEQPEGTPFLGRRIAERLLDSITESGRSHYNREARLRVHELKSLVGQRWLNGGIIERVIEIINNQSLDTFAYNFNVSRKAQDVPNVLYRCLKRRWPNELPKKIGFALHVGFKEGTVIIGDLEHNGEICKGTHFSSCLYDVESNHLLYGDSLAMPMPLQFWEIFVKFLALLFGSEKAKRCTVQQLHKNDNSSLSKHKCTSECWSFFPLQEDHSSCGISTIFALCLFALDDSAFFSLRGCPDTGNPKFDYLKNISQYSCFLRLVITKWIFSGNIDLTIARSERAVPSKSNESGGESSRTPGSTIFSSVGRTVLHGNCIVRHDSHFELTPDYTELAEECSEERKTCTEKRRHFHCLLCPKSRMEFFESRLKRHIESCHVNAKRIVRYGRLWIMPCKAVHDEKCYKREDVVHYHCPECGKAIQQRKFFEKHLKTHEAPQHISSIFDAYSPLEDMEGDLLKDNDGHDLPGAPTPKRVRSGKFRRNRSKRIHCTYCNMYISIRNMQRHMKTKHYSGEEQRFSAICCDRERGLYMVRKSHHGGIGYPLHVQKIANSTHGNVTDCELSSCRAQMQIAERSRMRGFE